MSRFLLLICGFTLSALAVRTTAQSLKPEVMERVKQATVMVLTSHSKSSEGDTPLGSGTGYFVNRTGLCISNDHVIDPAHGKSPLEKWKAFLEYNRLTWRVVVNSGLPDEKVYKANVLYSNDQADMAVMQAFDEDGTFLDTPNFLRFEPTDDVEIKSKLWNLGFPGGESRRQSNDKHPLIAIQTGNVVTLPRSPSGRVKGVYTNVLANQGNSGGPVVNINGNVVGIATLAGAADSGRAANTILIPADLTKEMIRIAFEEGKIAGGVDIFPFLDQLMDSTRVYRIPEYERSGSATCLTMGTESVICGRPTDDAIRWPTPLGEIEIPSDRFAYFIADPRNEEYGVVLLDGGDRFQILRDEATFDFTPMGGEPTEIDLQDVKAISFVLPKEEPFVPEGEVFVIGGEHFNLSIVHPKGKVRFTTNSDVTVEIPVEQVSRIEITEEEDTWLYTTVGSKMGGEFADHELTGELAWTKTPITFSFKNESLTSARMKTIDYRKMMRKGEPPLAESISTTDARFVTIAKSLDSGDVASGRQTLNTLLEPAALKSLTPSKKTELKRLEGEQLFLEGKFAGAADVFRKLRNADIEDVQWHARARLVMLERFPDGKFEGGVINDPKVFVRASRALAKEKITQAKRTLEELDLALKDAPPARTEYMKLIRRGEDVEDDLLTANRLRGGTTEELIVRLWRYLSYLHAGEVARLEKEREEFQENSQGSGQSRNRRGGGRGNVRLQQQMERKMTRFEKDIERAQEAIVELQVKISDAGFIIDDTDRDVTDEG